MSALLDVDAESSDRSLVERLARDDVTAWQELVRRHMTPVYRLALSITCDESDAADCVQETFIRVRRGAPRFARGEAVRSWIFKITGREALRIVERRQRRRRRARRYEETGTGAVAAAAESVAGCQEREEATTLLRSLVEGLPMPLRAVVTLHFFVGLNQIEIARQLACDRRTVAGRLRQALDLLRVRVEGAGLACVAAVPVLLAELPGAAPAPPAQLLERMAGGGPAVSGRSPVRGVSRRRRAASRRPGASVAGTVGLAVCVAVVAAGAALLRPLAPSPQSPPIETPVAPVAERIAHRWDFEGPDDVRGLARLAGAPWRWRQGAERRDGRIEIPQTEAATLLGLPERLPEPPFAIDVRCARLDEASEVVWGSLVPLADSQMVPTSWWADALPPERVAQGFFSYRWIIFDRHALCLQDGHEAAIVRVEAPWDRIALRCSGVSFDRVAITPLEAADLPAQWFRPDTLIGDRVLRPHSSGGRSIHDPTSGGAP